MAAYNDTFTDTDLTTIGSHTSDSGDTYSANTSGVINNNRVFWDNSTTKFAQIVGFTSDSEYTITIESYCYTDKDYIGVMFGATVFSDSPFNGYLLRLAPSRTIELYKYTGGTPTLLGSHVHGVADGNPLATLKAKASSTNLDIEYNGVDVITTTDTSYRAASLYLWGFGDVSTATGYHMDSIDYTQGVASGNPPVIDTPATANITATNLDVTFNTNEPDGTAYVYLSANRAEDTDAFIKANATQSLVITGAGPITVNIQDSDGLKDGLHGYAHIVHENSSGFSNILSTAYFEIPTLSNTYDIGSYPLSITGTAPDGSTDTDTGTLTVNSVMIPTGAATLTGQEPSFTIAKIVGVPSGSAVLSGFAPALSINDRREVPTGQLGFTGHAPLVIAGIPVDVEIPTGTAQFTSYAPTVIEGMTAVIDIPTASLSLTGYAATLLVGPTPVTSALYVSVSGRIEAGPLNVKGKI